MATRRVPRARIWVSTPDLGRFFRGESVSGHPGAWGGPKTAESGPQKFCKFPKQFMFMWFFPSLSHTSTPQQKTSTPQQKAKQNTLVLPIMLAPSRLARARVLGGFANRDRTLTDFVHYSAFPGPGCSRGFELRVRPGKSRNPPSAHFQSISAPF